MSVRRILIPLLCACLGPAASAWAGTFPGEVIDGPSADIVRVGEVDVGRDGTGAVAYIKRDAGVAHLFVSRLLEGTWQTPERLDNSTVEPVTQAVAAAGDNGKLAVAWVAGGTLYATQRNDRTSPFTGPQALASNARNPSIDLSTNGQAYLVWSSEGDVRAARLQRDSPAFEPLPASLDVDPSRPAGDTVARKPEVAVGADGTALAAWGEGNRVVARRLFGQNVSTAPQELNLEQLGGVAGGDADAPDVDIEDDSSFAWVVFRQEFGGVRRAIARRLLGSRFEAPTTIDGGSGESVDAPRIAMSGRGVGVAALGRSESLTTWASILGDDDEFGPGERFDSAPGGVPPRPQPAFAENGDGAVAWMLGSAGAPEALNPLDALVGGGPQVSSPDAQLRGRIIDDRKTGAEVPLSKMDLGPVDVNAGLSAAADRTANVTVVAIQGTGSDRRLTAAMLDRPPGSFLGYTTERFRPTYQPVLKWGTPLELWGAPTYTVLVDGRPAGTATKAELTPRTPLADGVHRWRVVASDRRGQTTASPLRLLRIDGSPPRISFSVSGTRRAGSRILVKATATDPAGGSGLKYVRIAFGDATPVLTARAAAHVYSSRGVYTIRVSATDIAGNAVSVTRQVTIAAKKSKGKKKK